LSNGHLTGLVAADCQQSSGEARRRYSPRRRDQSLIDAVRMRGELCATIGHHEYEALDASLVE
jgi:hypothetical protein